MPLAAAWGPLYRDLHSGEAGLRDFPVENNLQMSQHETELELTIKVMCVLSSHVQLPCCVQKILLPCHSSPFWNAASSSGESTIYCKQKPL